MAIQWLTAAICLYGLRWEWIDSLNVAVCFTGSHLVHLAIGSSD